MCNIKQNYTFKLNPIRLPFKTGPTSPDTLTNSFNVHKLELKSFKRTVFI